MTNRKLLFLDIEWRPVKAYVWKAWDETVSAPQILEDGGLLCLGYKWAHEKSAHVVAEWDVGHKQMLETAHAVMTEADAIIGYNSDRYDIPKLTGEFLRYGLAPVRPATSIDLIKTVRKCGFFMNNLAFVAPFLGIGQKVSHEGFILWKKVLDGDEKARKKMVKYCKQDVLLTEKLYNLLLPFIRNHPHLGTDARECGACGSNRLHSRGYRRTKHYRIQQLQCQDCGSWQEGRKEKVA